MKQEEKDILFKELSARYPYGVKLQVRLDYGDNGHKEGIYDADIEAITSYNIEVTYYDTNMQGAGREWTCMYEEVKPYLRPLSDMTEDEISEFEEFMFPAEEDDGGNYQTGVLEKDIPGYIDWLLAHHFDFRDLIKKGLAIEAPKGMYKELV